MTAPLVLIIRDGWGINPNGHATAKEDGNATLLAKTPFHDHLYATYPFGYLNAGGLDVGLPEGQMGNSEVGHLNLGAGRIVPQDLVRIDQAIQSHQLENNPALKDAFAKAAKPGTTLHLLGLVSDGGVHSHLRHLLALLQLAKQAGVDKIAIHAFTDGRDASPTGGSGYLKSVEAAIKPLANTTIATVIGRYFAMDRDHRWDRTQAAWDAIVLGKGIPCENQLPSEVVQNLYAQDKTDEFLPALIFQNPSTQRIHDGDVVLFWNYRSDRARQLTEAFIEKDFKGFPRPVFSQVHYLTMTQYDETFTAPCIFGPQDLSNILGEVVSNAGKTQLRIAETEKYPHVTYFFNGGLETPFPGEDRKIIPSPKVATYDLQPEMSAQEVTQAAVSSLGNYDLVILNFANPDMVGHTGVVEAAVRAVETVDQCVEEIVNKTLQLGGQLLLIADHGNCEFMRNADGSPNTAHTLNLVHCIYVSKNADKYKVENGILADVAPTILNLLQIPQPPEMTGHNLVHLKDIEL